MFIIWLPYTHSFNIPHNHITFAFVIETASAIKAVIRFTLTYDDKKISISISNVKCCVLNDICGKYHSKIGCCKEDMAIKAGNKMTVMILTKHFEVPN